MKVRAIPLERDSKQGFTVDDATAVNVSAGVVRVYAESVHGVVLSPTEGLAILIEQETPSMRLINFGVGEITDRLTILALKILHAKPGADTKHFQDERNALRAKLAGRNLNGAWFEQAVELGAVNSAIWFNEDMLRAHREGPHQRSEAIIVIAFGLQELNDRRHELIAEINKKAGDFFGKEKDHEPLATTTSVVGGD